MIIFMKKKLIYLILLIALWIGYGFYELAVWEWSKNEIGAVIRVDLFLIVPILISLSSFLIYFYFKKK